jgi:hypothetical protein
MCRQHDVSESRFTIVNIGTLSLNKFWGEAERRRSPSFTCTLLDVNGWIGFVLPSVLEHALIVIE